MTRVAVVSDDVDFAAALRRAAAEGYTHVEIAAMIDRPRSHLEALAETGLFVARVRLGVGLSDDDVEVRREQLGRLQRMVADAAILGATVALLSPPVGGERAQAYFEEGVGLLATYAMARGVRVAVTQAGD